MVSPSLLATDRGAFRFASFTAHSFFEEGFYG